MKKIFLMMALAATALFTTTACGNDDDDNNNGGGGSSSDVVVLTPPPFKTDARVVNLQPNDEGIRQLRMMESGVYMIAIEDAENGARATRSVDFVGCSFEFGNYTVSNGVFTFSNGMTITFAEQSGNNYEVTIKWKNGTTIKTTGTIDTSNAVTPGVMTDNLCSHAWTVEKVRAIGKVEGIKVAKDFNGPIDLAKVKEWYEEKFGKLKDEFDANTIIEGIYFDTHGLFTINYKNRKDDVGVWRWTDMNAGKLVYTWSDKLNAISLFSGDASVEFTKNPDTCKLTLKGNFSDYDIEFLFTLK